MFYQKQNPGQNVAYSTAVYSKAAILSLFIHCLLLLPLNPFLFVWFLFCGVVSSFAYHLALA